mmetsp:Transcript_43818/g.115156  ORF Transcript_43818/g.115156 Transcript_43818/m.115156 type:complete len:244 (+) Transcript_43818:185-916(+)
MLRIQVSYVFLHGSYVRTAPVATRYPTTSSVASQTAPPALVYISGAPSPSVRLLASLFVCCPICSGLPSRICRARAPSSHVASFLSSCARHLAAASHVHASVRCYQGASVTLAITNECCGRVGSDRVVQAWWAGWLKAHWDDDAPSSVDFGNLGGIYRVNQWCACAQEWASMTRRWRRTVRAGMRAPGTCGSIVALPRLQFGVSDKKFNVDVSWFETFKICGCGVRRPRSHPRGSVALRVRLR